MHGIFIKENLTVPNIMSLLRIVLIVPLSVFILQQNFAAAVLVLLLSALTDMFDGMIARRFNCVTQLGKILDPIADKLTLISVVLTLCFIEEVIAWFAGVFLAKEIVMLSGGYYLIKRKIRPPAAKWFGKAATVIFYSSVGIFVFLRAAFGFENKVLTLVLLALTAAAMLAALAGYARIFFDLIKKDDLNEEKE